MVVLISVGHTAAIENHRVIEQTSVSIRRGLEFVEEVGQRLDVISIDFRKVVHVGAVIRVMRASVETISNAAERICRRTEIAREHHCGNSRDARFVCQYLKIEHQLHVFVERFGHTYRRFRYLQFHRDLILSSQNAPFDLTNVIEILADANPVALRKIVLQPGHFLCDRIKDAAVLPLPLEPVYRIASIAEQLLENDLRVVLHGVGRGRRFPRDRVCIRTGVTGAAVQADLFNRQFNGR